MDKLIVILGPTASGKSDLAVALAKKFGGEIISADSRQVYRELDIGSGKITKREMRGVRHHLLDAASARRAFSAARFQKLAFKKIKQIQSRGKIPLLVGGTGFYIQSVVDNLKLPDAPPNAALRRQLAKKSPAELFLMLAKLDPRRAETIDHKNPRRLIRAIEVAKAPQSGQGPTSSEYGQGPTSSVLQIGVARSQEELKRRIARRLQERLKRGMVAEVRRLHQRGLSWKRLEELGMEYRYVARYLQQKITRERMIERLQKEIERFAKRQMTWFKRDKRIQWMRNPQQAETLVRDFLQPLNNEKRLIPEEIRR